jgi:DNA-binding PadR family transcriptional regulator
MDEDLHLLMLIHQQLEEARSLGHVEPRLEFHVEPSLLTTRVTDTDAVEEISYGGMHHAGRLVEEPVEALKRLDADGYVELEYEGDEPPVGTVVITEKGLEKVRYRRAYESNRPRSFKMWEIFPLHGQVRHMRLWRAGWEGREILVKNRRVFLGKDREPVTEYLAVDQRFSPGHRVEKSRFSKDLYGELRSRDGVHELHAHIGLTAPLLKTGCLIAVDGVVIGGDVGKRFLT